MTLASMPAGLQPAWLPPRPHADRVRCRANEVRTKKRLFGSSGLALSFATTLRVSLLRAAALPARRVRGCITQRAMTTSAEKISFGAEALPGYVFGAKGAPGVIMVQEWWGVNEQVGRASRQADILLSLTPSRR